MSHKHSNSRLYMFNWCIYKGSISNYRGDCTMNYMINFELFQRKYLCQSASDFILKNHRFESFLTIDLFGLKSPGNDNWVKVVMAKLSGLKVWLSFSVAKNSSIGVPLSNRSAICSDGFDVIWEERGSETNGIVFRDLIQRENCLLSLKGFVLENWRGIGS